ncbi:MAG: hypothetical protein ACEY3L_03625, partial [Wolbachia sp.]
MQNGKLDGYRKNSFFTWAERGERFVERMLSIFLTSVSMAKIPSKSYDCLVLYSFSQSVNGYLFLALSSKINNLRI